MEMEESGSGDSEVGGGTRERGAGDAGSVGKSDNSAADRGESGEKCNGDSVKMEGSGGCDSGDISRGPREKTFLSCHW